MDKIRKLGLPVVGLAALYLGWRVHGWGGVALVAGGIVMWVLLHFTRVLKVLQRAADRPVGYCDSAVMLNAKLKPRVNLLHVVALTRALGEQLSPKEAQPEIFRWTDGSGSSVTCEFVRGKLAKWQLVRPEAAPEQGAQPSP
jgi:hypothetical protein